MLTFVTKFLKIPYIGVLELIGIFVFSEVLRKAYSAILKDTSNI